MFSLYQTFVEAQGYQLSESEIEAIRSMHSHKPHPGRKHHHLELEVASEAAPGPKKSGKKTS